jgi:HK97 family phage prohead protease
MDEAYKLGRMAGYDPADVWLVDGQYIRDNIYVDFTLGGNDIIYGSDPRSKHDFIPPNCIYIDNGVIDAERPFIVLHEIFERNRMLNDGMEYEPAHEGANTVERAARANPEAVYQMIKDELKLWKVLATAPATEGAKMDTLIRKILSTKVKAVAGKDRVLEFIGSTEAVDRDDERIKMDGWQLGDYLKNPVVLWAHRYDEPPIGKTLSVRAVEGKLIFQVEFATAEMYPFADTIYRLSKGGFINTTSVGFKPLEWETGNKAGEPRRTYIKQELLELSIVPVPSNPDALIQAREAGLITVKEFERLTKPPPLAPEQKSGISMDTTTSLASGVTLFRYDSSANAYLPIDMTKWVPAPAPAGSGKTEHRKAVSQGEIQDDLDYVAKAINEYGMSPETRDIAFCLISDILRVAGSDIPDYILGQFQKQGQARLRKALEDALEKVGVAIDSDDTHHAAHNDFYKCNKDALVKCRESLMGLLDGDNPNDKPEGDDDTPEGEPDKSIVGRMLELKKGVKPNATKRGK